MTTTTTKPPRRWYLRFSLRTGLALVTLLCLFFGLYVRPALRQREAVQELRAGGFCIFYDFQRCRGDRTRPGPTLCTVCDNEHWFDEGNSSPWPGWLVDRAGIDFFHRPVLATNAARYDRSNGTYQEFNSPPIRPIPDQRNLAYLQLRELPSVTAVYLHFPNLDNDHLAVIASLPALRELRLTGPHTNRELPDLTLLRRLEGLVALELPARCEQLDSVLPTNLERLDLWFVREVTAKDVQAIVNRHRLKHLNLAGGATDHDVLESIYQLRKKSPVVDVGVIPMGTR